MEEINFEYAAYLMAEAAINEAIKIRGNDDGKEF